MAVVINGNNTQSRGARVVTVTAASVASRDVKTVHGRLAKRASIVALNRSMRRTRTFIKRDVAARTGMKAGSAAQRLKIKRRATAGRPWLIFLVLTGAARISRWSPGKRQAALSNAVSTPNKPFRHKGQGRGKRTFLFRETPARYPLKEVLINVGQVFQAAADRGFRRSVDFYNREFNQYFQFLLSQNPGKK